METKNIELDILSALCKYKNETKNTCIEEDNISGRCDCSECPIWNDLITSEAEY